MNHVLNIQKQLQESSSSTPGALAGALGPLAEALEALAGALEALAGA